MNPPQIGGARAFNELYSDEATTNAAGQKRSLAAAEGGQVEKRARTEDDGGLSRRIYVGGLTPSVTERPLAAFFAEFGDVRDCRVVRDRVTGISRGFAFLTFGCESSAKIAVERGANQPHIIEGRAVRVSMAKMSGNSEASSSSGGYRPAGGNAKTFMKDLVILDQKRIYVGPLAEDVLGQDLTAQFAQFGVIEGVSRLKPTCERQKQSYGFVDYAEDISTRRAFSSKVFVKGRHVKVSLSRFAMELLLSPTVVFFHEAHLACDAKRLEAHFSGFGRVFRCAHLWEATGPHKSYGFVDFVDQSSVAQAAQQKQQLLYPGQYVRVSRALPQANFYDLLGIGDQQGADILKQLDGVVPDAGSWGAERAAPEAAEATITSKVRIPAAAVSRLIGERGRTIADICRNAKVKITIPKNEANAESVVISVSGVKENIRTATYLMQKVVKGNSQSQW